MEKLKLRKLRASDIDEIMKNFINEKILTNINIPKKANEITKSFEMKWFRNVIKNYKLKKPKEYTLAIIIKSKPSGVIDLHKIDYDNRNAEVGCWIAEQYWGKGYGTTALKEFLKEINKRFNFIRITGYVNEDNVGSQRILEKNGFKLECIRKKAVKKGSKYINDKQYALVK